MSTGSNPLFRRSILGTAICAVMLTGCGGSDSNSGVSFPEGAIMLPAENLTQAAKEAFITAESGDVIVFPEGRFQINDTLLFDGDTDGDGTSIKGITIMGYGKEKTILDFAESDGGDGIFVQNGVDIEIRDIGVYEAPNNAIKLKDTSGIIIDDVATVWEGELNSGNGAYGLYPVECDNILIEDSYVRGSADAGVYVGQSHDIVVRRNIAEENVAGIEIENSMNADVYDNIATGNTGGILVFDLPIGGERYGSNVRVFDNLVEGNNTDNFANTSDSAAGVHIVPPGTGVIVLSTPDVEIYNNIISDHDTLSVAISSFLLADENLLTDSSYDPIIASGWQPVPRNINVHDNNISISGTNPRGKLITDIIAGYLLDPSKGKMPTILYDGLGELLANASAAPTILGAPFDPQVDAICATANGDVSYGQVYGTIPDGTTIDQSTGTPIPKLFLEEPQSQLLVCETAPSRLQASQATIGGKSYGCGSNETGDASAASCAL
ncbi:right-handed parallel beta-helix repeat-containing protein [Marinobacter salinisoli]|uniref:mannuronan 5-epimerase n=1 Tax=Marinobacter salinisoli TaxID=2769486 RepID=A0ABX7MWQ1_9GAMM|nr:parallel beta-helix domain-containing protein [Marinobacter salinisoli]QSP95804.1 right-handed parallel beta-helix repeat-containing protein [Marinobacter salinisoli]